MHFTRRQAVFVVMEASCRGLAAFPAVDQMEDARQAMILDTALKTLGVTDAEIEEYFARPGGARDLGFTVPKLRPES